MMKTEEEARKSRCCGPKGCGRSEYAATEVEVNTDETTFRDFKTTVHFTQHWCIASECMAWRPEVQDQSDSPFGGQETPTGRGYCGLAGRPC